MLASLVVFMISMPSETRIYTADNPQPVGMTIGFILSMISASAVYLVQGALLGKSLANCKVSRGVLLGSIAFVTSCGVLLIDALGGQLYDIDWHYPIIIAISSESLVILTITVLAIAGELRI